MAVEQVCVVACKAFLDADAAASAWLEERVALLYEATDCVQRARGQAPAGRGLLSAESVAHAGRLQAGNALERLSACLTRVQEDLSEHAAGLEDANLALADAKATLSLACSPEEACVAADALNGCSIADTLAALDALAGALEGEIQLTEWAQAQLHADSTAEVCQGLLISLRLRPFVSAATARAARVHIERAARGGTSSSGA